jgi:hypothetical protein
MENESFYESLKAFFEEKYEEDKYFIISDYLCQYLTLEQMDKLADLHQKIREDETFIGHYFQKYFAEELSLRK